MVKYGVSVLKKLLLFLILTASLVSSSLEIEKGIYQTILRALFPSKNIIRVWSDEASKKSLFSSIDGVRLVKNRKDADILMLFHTYDIKQSDKAVFANGYLVLQRSKGNAVGGFYWQKGRPNLVFVKNKLQEFGIVLPKNLRGYIEDIK